MAFYIRDKIHLANIAKIKHSRIKDGYSILQIPTSLLEDCSLVFCRTDVFRRTNVILCGHHNKMAIVSYFTLLENARRCCV